MHLFYSPPGRSVLDRNSRESDGRERKKIRHFRAALETPAFRRCLASDTLIDVPDSGTEVKVVTPEPES
jgi:hypothetical protein